MPNSQHQDTQPNEEMTVNTPTAPNDTSSPPEPALADLDSTTVPQVITNSTTEPAPADLDSTTVPQVIELTATPTTPPERTTTLEPEPPNNTNPQLTPNDINFPRLLSPPPKETFDSQEPDLPEPERTPVFVWRKNPDPAEASQTQPANKSKKPIVTASAPLTRQGYRSGRLADDFWTTLSMPNTPHSKPKRLQVIPFLIKDRQSEHAEYLVDKSRHPNNTIAQIQIAELLAGIPWTQTRARQHVVDEVSQSLHKFLIFNNNLSSPFKSWSQGRWFAQWSLQQEGENICTLFVCVAVQENKIKPRKGRTFGWRRVPTITRELLTAHNTEDIHDTSAQGLWHQMTGDTPESHTAPQTSNVTPNRFSVLAEEEVNST